MAAITIQSCVRRFIHRKKMQIIRKEIEKRGLFGNSLRQAPWYILHPKYSAKNDRNRQGAITGPSASQSLRQKFLTSPFNIMTKNEDRCM